MKSLKKWVSFALAAVMILSLLTACGEKPSDDPGKDDPGKDPVVTKKEDLIIVMPEDLATFDPLGTTNVRSQAIHRMVYTRLYIDSDEGNMDPVPALAKEFNVISDSEIQIVIYTDWKYSDGSTITVDDVVYCLNRARESASFKTTMAQVTGYEKVNDSTLAIKTSGPIPSIKHALKHTGTSILPKAYVEKALADGDWTNPICSGPYKLEKRVIGEYTKVAKNEQYNASVAVPQNKSLTFKVVPESNSRTVQVETGEADLNFSFSATDYARCKENKELQVLEKPGITNYYVGMDITAGPLKDVRVRQAINYAINREDVLTAIAEGIGVASYCVVPPTTQGFLNNPGNYKYDVQKAKDLMKEAGYENGFTTKLVAFDDECKRTAEVVAMFLAEIGIKADVDLLDVSTLGAILASHSAPMLIATWGASPDAALVLPRLFKEDGVAATSNLTYYHNDQIDKILDEAGAIYDEKERVTKYEECVKIIAEEAPWCPLFLKNSLALARADLQGIVLSPETPRNFWTLHY